MQLIFLRVLLSFFCGISFPLAVFAADTFTETSTDFENFKQQQNQQQKQQQNIDDQSQSVDVIKKEFSQYKTELEEGFFAYKEAYKNAVNKERRAVSDVWGEYRPGDKKRWVQYDVNKEGHRNVRQSVDFESGDVELEMVVDQQYSSKDAERQLKENIIKLLKTTRRDAFKKDYVAQVVENKLSTLPQVKTAIMSNEPMMQPLIASFINDKTAKKYTSQSKTDVRSAKKPGKKIVRVKFKIAVDVPHKSKMFIQTANKIAKVENLPLTLVMAIMETESAFNPMAKSPVPAYGLMQIVPRSAGQDATKYLFGKTKILSPSYLYNSDKNIAIGGAYLHILYFRYLAKINNPISRLYCTIAAYNTGAGNVARVFIGTTNINKAVLEINQLSPKHVYKLLRKKLPYKETQNYLKNVSLRMQKYKAFDTM